jgi:RHS repeat-associated protein
VRILILRCSTGVIALAMLLAPAESSAAAGRTPGSFSVSPTGAATYSIPMWEPPGTRGLQPNLSLDYNSRSPDGSLGPGWNVSGLSAITRCQKTVEQDGVDTPIALTSADVFCLDGNRLRVTSGLATYGVPGSTYQTEFADFSLVTANATAGNGPQWFLVQGKNGLYYEYGNTADSRVTTSTSVPTPYTWLLNKVYDRDGNSYVITYGPGAAGSSGVAVPVSASYTPSTKGSTSYNYTISFTWVARQSLFPNSNAKSVVGYIAGTATTNTNLLASVAIQSVGTTVRQYNLTYSQAPATTRARVTQIKECADAAGTNCLAPTIITYQSAAAGVGATATVSNTLNGLPGCNGGSKGNNFDFDGDGRADLCYSYNSTYWVAFAAGGYSVVANTSIPITNSVVTGRLARYGRDGFLTLQNGVWWFYQWNGSAFAGVSTGATGVGTDYTLLVDTDGDGLRDLVTRPRDNTNPASISIRKNITPVGGNALFATTPTTTASNCLSVPDGGLNSTVNGHIFSVPNPGYDFNHDGREDIVETCQTAGINHPRSFNLMTSTGTGFNSPALLNGYFFGVLDVNDDGCTDQILGTGLTGATVSILPAQCNGSDAAALAAPWGSNTPILYMDWDGDGRTDVLVNNGGTFGVYLSTGTGYSALVSTTFPYSSANTYFVTDVDGDGLDDLAYYNTNIGSIQNIRVFTHNGGVGPDLVASITDGYGVSVVPAFIAVPNTVNYTPAAPQDWPSYRLSQSMTVVRQVQMADGVGSQYTKSYAYGGGVVDGAGRGFEGFEYISVTDSRPQSPVIKTTYAPAWVVNQPLVPVTTVYQHDGVTPISITNPVGQQVFLDNTQLQLTRVFDSDLRVTVTEYQVGGASNGLPITQSVTNYAYDTSGNVTQAATVVTDLDAASPYLNQQWGSTTNRSIAPSTANWCLGLPTQIQVINTAPGVPNITRTVGYTPDYAKCRATQQIVEPSSGTYAVTETFGFDSFGNVNSDSIAGIGMPARVTGVTWSDATHTTGQFPLLINNALNQGAGRGYDYNLGVQTSETDPNGIQTTWHFDPFARRDTETRADGTSTVISYNDCVNVAGGCQNGDPASSATGINRMVVIATRKDSGGTAIRDDWTYLDQFNRTIVTKTKTLSGGYNRIGTQYDALGNVYRRTAPCDAASCTAYWTTNSYDALNRLSQQQRPISAANSTLQTTTFTYLGRTTTVTDPQGKQTTKITKVTGSLGRSQDHNGYYQTFNHDAFGNVLSVADSLSNTLFTATYDYGIGAFQRDATDMDVDVSTASGQHRRYNYNALGEIVSYADAKGQNFTFDPFDALGRPTKRTEPDLTTTWTWGATAASHNIGKLASVATTGGSVFSESFAFDSAGRLSNDTKQGLPFDYTYNAQGSLDTQTYPTSTSAYRLKLQYLYQNGLLQQVKDFNATTVFWTANAENPLGEVTQETLGNGVITNRSFDAVTGWLASIQAGVGGGTGLQNQSYLYDLVGNVTQRQNNALGLTESFCYDNVYRLDHSTLTGLCTGATNLQMVYDAMGNITSRSDIASGATWTYSTTHKHQALQAGDAGHTYTYDPNGNAITRNGFGISWTSYNYPLTMNASGESSTFSYGPDHEKWKQVYTGPSGTETTTYYGKVLETVATSSGTDWRHYIFAGSEAVAVYSRTSGGTNTLRYTLEDHLISPSAITSNTGTLIVNENFAAFGSRRNPTTWSGAPTAGDLTTIAGVTRQGYAGQTMLGSMGLIHMDGRVQDSITGRFLSPDPYVTGPGNTQNFNRYGYVYNNPLSFIDPSGFAAKCNSDNFTQCEDTPLDEVTVYGPTTIDPAVFAREYDRAKGQVSNSELAKLEEVVVTGKKAQGQTPCAMLAAYQAQQTAARDAQDQLARALDAAGMSADATEAILEQVKNLPPGANLAGVGAPNQWIWLSGAAAARYGAGAIDPVAAGGTYITGALRAGAGGALRVVPVVGNVITGVSIGYELGQRNWDSAAYKTFDAAATAAAVRYGKGWGALTALAYNFAGGSQAIAKNLALVGLSQACAAEMGAGP